MLTVKRQYFLPFILLLVLMAQSCTSAKIRQLDSSDVFENRYFSFSPPKQGWYLVGEEEWYSAWNGKGLWRKIHNNAAGHGHLEIKVMSRPITSNDLFEKNVDYEKDYLEFKNDPKNKEVDREQGIGYTEYETQYFQGMKCGGSVFSRNYAGPDRLTPGKEYKITCGYYHKVEGKRTIEAIYVYYGASGESSQQRSKGLYGGDNAPLSIAEVLLKEAVEEVLGTIVLKDVDWDRMKKEGLIYDKPYKTMSW